MCEHGTKTTSVSLPADGDATSKFGLLTIWYHSATRKHLFLYAQGDRSGLRKPKKRIIINTNSSYHQRSSP